MVTTIVKFCLKSLQEFVRLQTFNRSGFQQIQLDIQFLRTTLRETAEDEAAIDFLLDEVLGLSLQLWTILKCLILEFNLVECDIYCYESRSSISAIRLVISI